MSPPADAREVKSVDGGLIGISIAVGTFGMVFVVAFFLAPLWQVAKALRWEATPCTIVSSEVVAHPDPEAGSASYALELRYTFQAPDPARGGAVQTFVGDRYGFGRGGVGPTLDSNEAMVAANPAGRRRTCWIDPRRPQDAVLDRSPTMTMLIMSYTLVFPVTGYGLAWWAWRSRRRRAAAGADDGARWRRGTAGDAASGGPPAWQHFVTCAEDGTPLAVHRVMRSMGRAEVWKPEGWQPSEDFMRRFYTTGFDGDVEEASEATATMAIRAVARRLEKARREGI